MRLPGTLTALTLLLLSPPGAPAQEMEIREAALRGDLKRVTEHLRRAPRLAKTERGLLCMAAYSGSQPLVLFLLKKGRSVHEKDFDGSTPLHQAAAGGHRPIAQLLLARGARVNARRTDGWTPLHAAAATGSAELVGLLLARGAGVNLKGGVRNETPLTLALKYENREVASLLKKRGGKP